MDKVDLSTSNVIDQSQVRALSMSVTAVMNGDDPPDGASTEMWQYAHHLAWERGWRPKGYVEPRPLPRHVRTIWSQPGDDFHGHEG